MPGWSVSDNSRLVHMLWNAHRNAVLANLWKHIVSGRLFVVAVLRYTDPKFSSYGAEEYKPLSMDRSVCLELLLQITFSVLRLPSACPA